MRKNEKPTNSTLFLVFFDSNDALGRYGALWDALGRSGTLWDALGRSGMLWGTPWATIIINIITTTLIISTTTTTNTIIITTTTITIIATTTTITTITTDPKKRKTYKFYTVFGVFRF